VTRWWWAIAAITTSLGCGPSPVASAPTPDAARSAPPPTPSPIAVVSAPPTVIEPAPPPGPEPAFAVPALPPRPEDGRRYQHAPAALEHVIIKLSHPAKLQFDNLRCEGHNALVADGATDGEVVAERWRSVVAGTAGVFVLRDSIWSQQDHPYRRTPFALMMPPSWVTVAVARVMAQQAIVPPVAPVPEDDVAWAAITTVEALFGDFPPSDSLHREAIVALAHDDPEQRHRTRTARMSLRSLAADVRAMMAVAAHGPDAVALVGARRIAASDRRYFGDALRFHRVVPIFVENPNTKELQSEGKGMVPPPYARRPTMDAKAIVLARDAVYRRRLRDGDLAIERYDLSVPAEQDRAIALLEALIPAAEPAEGGKLWLWVTGRLDPHRKAEGENAVKYLPAFRKRIAGAALAHDRLEIVSKPSTDIPPGPGRAKAFQGDARWYRHRALPYSVRLTATDLSRILAQ
jgi:hypothetical protein